MTLKLAVVMDPIETIKPVKDSSFAILLAAQRRGWQCSVIEHRNLYWHNHEARAPQRQVRLTDASQNWFEVTQESDTALQDYDIILMRSDPPVDADYITACQILGFAEAHGVLVANPTSALLQFNEKLASLNFPELCPTQTVSQHPQQLRDFVAEHQRAVIKPLDGMGGRGIFVTRIDDPNLSVILETASQHGTRHCLAQAYLDEITSSGDKRILMIDGQPIPHGLARIPQGSDHRGNLAAGGQGQGFDLSTSDHQICEQVGPWLRQQGIRFAGIDVIGDKLTEINITSPTCIREIDRLYQLDIADQLLASLQASVG